MEYCEGGELFVKLKELGRFSEAHVADIMRQLFGAVNFCHSKKVVHRDLKPENILLVSTGR
jgi:calcium-dependent protein kinase